MKSFPWTGHRKPSVLAYPSNFDVPRFSSSFSRNLTCSGTPLLRAKQSSRTRIGFDVYTLRRPACRRRVPRSYPTYCVPATP